MKLLLSLLLLLQLPKPVGYVNDFAELLSEHERKQLELKLSWIDKETSVQFAVVTVNSIGDKTAKEYATELGNTWGVGQQDKDNGIVILIAKDEKEIYIATGLGISQTIPSASTQEIVDQFAIPLLKNGAYYGGLENAIDALMGKWGSGGVAKKNKANKGTDLGNSIALIVILGLFIWIFYQGIKTKRAARRSTGYWGSSHGGDSGFGGGSFGGDGGGGSFGDGGGGGDGGD